MIMMQERKFEVFCAAAELMVEECNERSLSSEELKNLEVKFVRFEKYAYLQGLPGECLYLSSEILMLANVLEIHHYISAKESSPIINFFYI